MNKGKRLGHGERSWRPAILCTVVALLLFSVVSIPANSVLLPSLGGFLSSLPFVGVVSNVGTFSLTQVRYSLAVAAIPIAIIVLALMVFVSARDVVRLKISVCAAGFLAFGFIACTSALLFGDTLDAAKLLVYVLAAVLFFCFSDVEKERARDLLIALCLAAGVINALITLWQFAVLSGWAFAPSSIRTHRPDGIFGDSIISALFSAVCIAVVLLDSRERPLYLRAAIVTLCALAGIATGSRSFYMLVAIIAVLIVFAGSRDVSLGKKTLIVLIVFFAALLFVVTPTGQSLLASLTFEESMSSRDMKRQIAFDLFKESPLLGIGTGQYAEAEAAMGFATNTGLHGTNPHNVYFQVLCENGIIAFICLGCSTLMVLASVLKQRNALACVLLLVYFAIAWSLGILYNVSFTTLFVVLMCALLSGGAARDA